MISVNQINAQCKLTEIGKALNTNNYPLKFKECPRSRLHTRSNLAAPRLEITSKSKRSCNSFMGDCPRLWNAAPLEIKNAKTISSAKNAIKKFIKTLPV